MCVSSFHLCHALTLLSTFFFPAFNFCHSSIRLGWWCKLYFLHVQINIIILYTFLLMIFVKSPCLWALVWSSKPLFHPKLNVFVNWVKLGIVSCNRLLVQIFKYKFWPPKILSFCCDSHQVYFTKLRKEDRRAFPILKNIAKTKNNCHKHPQVTWIRTCLLYLQNINMHTL